MPDSDEPVSPKQLPKPAEILAQIELGPLAQIVEEKYVTRFGRQAVEVEERYEHLIGLRDHYRHKRGWSVFLACVMSVMIGFQILLLALVGAGIWTFAEYDWLLPALLVQNLAQVIGLAVIVVKSLFKDMRD